jgi:hypothetical protein
MTAVDTLPVQAPDDISVAAAGRAADVGSVSSNLEVDLTLVIFALALIAIGVFYVLIRTEKATPYLMRMYVILILVFGSLLVVSSSYATEQIAPVIGFFGTIAGYLLGRSEHAEPD